MLISFLMKVNVKTETSFNLPFRSIHVKSLSLGGDSLFLISSPSWPFISLLEVGISLFLNIIFYRIIFSLKWVNCIKFCNENALLSQQSIHKV